MELENDLDTLVIEKGLIEEALKDIKEEMGSISAEKVEVEAKLEALARASRTQEEEFLETIAQLNEKLVAEQAKADDQAATLNKLSSDMESDSHSAASLAESMRGEATLLSQQLDERLLEVESLREQLLKGADTEKALTI